MAKQKVVVHIGAELAAEVRAVIGPEGFMTEAVDAALRLWLAAKRASIASGAAKLSQDREWSNAYRPPSAVRAFGD
jgi:hypothetical protein